MTSLWPSFIFDFSYTAFTVFLWGCRFHKKRQITTRGSKEPEPLTWIIFFCLSNAISLARSRHTIQTKINDGFRRPYQRISFVTIYNTEFISKFSKTAKKCHFCLSSAMFNYKTSIQWRLYIPFFKGINSLIVKLLHGHHDNVCLRSHFGSSFLNSYHHKHQNYANYSFC